jgi:two-component system, chemotaxis family, protein-glutamate methylesterase/glutaminase
MAVLRSGANYSVRIHDEAPVNRHRPSVDVLFRSCAREIGENAVAAILTGMGNDGARGMLAMREAGARTVAQDEATSVVFGMPREAIALGAADEIAPLDRIASILLRMCATSGAKS